MNSQQNHDNAARRAAHQWRERLKNRNRFRGPTLILAWLLFGVLMVVGFIIGVAFLLLGWLMIPFLRHSLKKRAHKMQHQSSHNNAHQGAPRRTGHKQNQVHIIEGDYEVQERESRR